MRNRYSRDLTWKWVKDNWSWIEKTFKHDASYDYFPRYIAGSLVTKKQLDEYLAFFEPMKKDLALKRNIEIGIGEIQGRIDLIERDKAAVRQTLSNL